jgi:hypothetical protein
MMAHWTLPHLYALLLGRGATPWRWELVETEAGETPVYVLAQDDGTGGKNECGVYAVGEPLSLQARVLARVTPSLLKEASERAMRVEDARERLQSLTQLAQRLSQRAYAQKRSDEYGDLQHLRQSLALLQKLLDASASPGVGELMQWEDETQQQAQQGPTPTGNG